MANTELSVQELLDKIKRGDLRLPEMQRGYVWKAPQVHKLLDSLYRGYPSGTILAWETDEKVSMRDMAVSQENNTTPFHLLLDGQQRLTSLAAVINGKPIKVRGRERPIEILFNLNHPEKLETPSDIEEDEGDEGDEGDEDDTSTEGVIFAIDTNKLASLPQWVKVSEVFQENSDKKFMEHAGVKDFKDPYYDKYSARLRRLRDIRKYKYRMDVLQRNLSYEEVTDIFVRVNSLGIKLRGSDLALAQITAKWKDSLKVFESFQEQCENEKFDLDIGTLLRNLVVFATGQSRFSIIGKLSLEKLKENWEKSCKGMEYAINFLHNNVGIKNPALLSSPYILIVLAAYGNKNNYAIAPEKTKMLRRWALLANTKGHYSRGASETILDQDLLALNEGDITKMIGVLEKQVGKLDISPNEIEGLKQNSAMFKTMFLAFKASGAKDWKDGLEIALDHKGAKHRLQYHHIFPKKILENARYKSSQINDIANLCFISGNLNRNISAKAPAKYFPDIIKTSGKESFDKQCIPHDEKLLAVEKYPEFLAERRKRIVKRLNGFLENTPAGRYDD